MKRFENSVERAAIVRLVADALREDLGSGDVTTGALVPRGLTAKASIVADGDGVMGGAPMIEILYSVLGVEIEWDWLKQEGDSFLRGDVLCSMIGDAAGILTGERTGLNLLQHISGISMLTRKYVKALQGTGVQLLDTRKTTPGLREIEKYAVRVGGGVNHRMGLYDRVLIKDNHLAVVSDQAEAIRLSRTAFPNLILEIEVVDLTGLRDALSAGPDWVLLDNMSTEQLRECVNVRDSYPLARPKLEASGGITLETVRAIGLTGVDAVSVGALTHSAVWVDISMEVEI